LKVGFIADAMNVCSFASLTPDESLGLGPRIR
jgi:hypothetical protein